MITRNHAIPDLNLSFFGEPYIREWEHCTPNGNLYNLRLPLSCGYNSHWQLSHVCTNCGSEAVYGFENPLYPSRKLDKTSFISTGLLLGRRYEQPFLEAIVGVFEGVELVSATYFGGLEAQVVDKAQGHGFEKVESYQCAHCKANYLARITMIAPMETERGTRGHIGELIIDEIAEVSIANGETFEGLITKYKKQPPY